jgi:hypothetical protein
VKNNPKKYRVAKKLLAISENKFIKERNRLKEEHGPEDESEMAKAQLAAIIEKSTELHRMLDGVTQLEDWLQYKLSIAENYIDAIHGYIKYFNGEDDMEHEISDEDELQWDDVEEEDLNTLMMKKTLMILMILMMIMMKKILMKKMNLSFKNKG